MKELPYFKFFPSEWITGNITLCSLPAQGLFINVCAWYWVKGCSLNIDTLTRRSTTWSTTGQTNGQPDSKPLVEELEKMEIIKVNKETGEVEINFLNEQYNELIHERERLKKASAMGVLARKKNITRRSTGGKPHGQPPVKPMVNLKDKDLDKDKEEDKDLDKIKSESGEILLYLNKVTGKNFKEPGVIERNLLEGRTLDEHKKIIDVKRHDPHFIENPQFMNPETLFGKKFDTYLNQRIEDFQRKGKSNGLYGGDTEEEANRVFTEMWEKQQKEMGGLKNV